MNANRFALLSMDDDELEEQDMPKVIHVEQPPITVPLPAPTATRKWAVQEGRPETTRQWNLEAEKTKHKRGPFSRYAFRDEDHARTRMPRAYAFHDDDSPSPESQKPVSPVSPQYPSAIPLPPVAVDSLKQEDFPKLSDHVRPQTPPYPPDDGWYPTLAERIRVSIERSEEEARFKEEQSQKRVINMDTLIPMPTKISKNLPIQ